MKTTRGGARRCTSEKDVKELVYLIDNFKESGAEIQQARISRLKGMAASLSNDDARRRAGELREHQERVNNRLDLLRKDMDKQIQRIRQNDGATNEVRGR